MPQTNLKRIKTPEFFEKALRVRGTRNSNAAKKARVKNNPKPPKRPPTHKPRSWACSSVAPPTALPAVGRVGSDWTRPCRATLNRSLPSRKFNSRSQITIRLPRKIFTPPSECTRFHLTSCPPRHRPQHGGDGCMRPRRSLKAGSSDPSRSHKPARARFAAPAGASPTTCALTASYPDQIAQPPHKQLPGAVECRDARGCAGS